MGRRSDEVRRPRAPHSSQPLLFPASAKQDCGRDESYGLDEQFLRAIEDGMPQAGGAGLGIDRIVMILTGAERLSDVLLFPMT